MPKIAPELRPAAVKALSTKPGVHAVGGVVGLYLQVTASSANPPGPPAASWSLRRTLKTGTRSKIGLGSYSDVSLAVAREQARQLTEQIATGADPQAQRRASRSTAQAARLAALTFDDAARLCVEKLAPGWDSDKHAAQWTATLAQYASPVIGTMLVEHIEMQHVLKVLDPIWEVKAETASRLRMRVEKVIAFADARAKRERPNPARWKHNLDTQLAKPSAVKKVRNHPALAIGALPRFMADLSKQEGMGARALEFAILTAARSGEVRGMTWDEVNLDAGIWTVPAERMKMKREHRVPLSPAAVALLKSLPLLKDCKLVFWAPRGGAMSDMTLAACIKRMNREHEKPVWVDPRSGEPAVPHGFRSTFRDWAAERTTFPHEMAEVALAHKVSNAVEAAYRRGDMLEKRARMMQAWTLFCVTVQPSTAKVVPMAKKVAG